MVWQDIVLSIGQWVFAIGLLPSVFGKDKPALLSSLIMGSVLVVFVFTFATLSLWLSAVSTIAGSLIWFVLAAQKIMINRKEKSTGG